MLDEHRHFNFWLDSKTQVEWETKRMADIVQCNGRNNNDFIDGRISNFAARYQKRGFKLTSIACDFKFMYFGNYLMLFSSNGICRPNINAWTRLKKYWSCASELRWRRPWTFVFFFVSLLSLAISIRKTWIKQKTKFWLRERAKDNRKKWFENSLILMSCADSFMNFKLEVEVVSLHVAVFV